MTAPVPAAKRSAAGLRQRLHGALPDQAALVLGNAGSLVATVILTSGMGFVYWALAARSFSPAAVGFASAVISAMTFVATIASLGLGTMLMGEIPKRRTEAAALARTTFAIAAVLGAIVGVGVAFLAPVLSSDLRPLSHSLGGLGLFAVGCAVTSLGLVADQAMIGFLTGGRQLVRNGVLGVSKLIFLGVAIALALSSGLSIFTTWVVGSVLSLAVPLRTPALRERRGVQWLSPAIVRRHAAGHQMLNSGLKTPQLLLPVLVVSLLSVEANATFYIAWMVAAFLAAVPGSLSNVLYAVGAADPKALAAKLRFTLSVSAAVLTVLVAAAVLLAHPALSLFGEAYARDGTGTMRILALASFPLIIRNHYVAVARITGRVRQATRYIWAGAVMELLAAYVGGRVGGLIGIAGGWTAILTLEAVLMARPVIGAARNA